MLSLSKHEVAMMFDGRRVLVTGSTRGIGRAAAAAFLNAGAEVVVHGRAPRDVERAAGELALLGSCSGFAADLSRREEVRRLAAEAGEIDVLVNNAGIHEEASLEAADEAHWDRIIAVNVTAPWLLSKALLSGLARRKGLIVNVGSDSGLLGYSQDVVYCASKGAIIGLTRALAVELAPHVRALCVCPGPVDTDMMHESLKRQPDPEAARRQWEAFPLLGRVARPKEIAAAIVFAASPAWSYATGSLIVVDGGTTAGKRV